VRRFSALIAFAAACAFPAAASAASGGSSSVLRPSPVETAQSNPTAPVPASAPNSDSAAPQLSPARVLAIANALPRVRALRAENPHPAEFITDLPDGDRAVLYVIPNGTLPPKEIGQVTIDGRSGRVLEALTGIQLFWQAARGIPGQFGRHVSALYVWLPMCLLFMLPFFNFRRPFSLLHLDLLVLLSFSVSFAFFNHAHIYASVPLVYPPLIYLLARMLALMRRDTVREGARPLRLLVPVPWLAVAVVLLIGFRIALNVTDSNVIDVGAAGVFGAHRITAGEPLYGSYPHSHEHQDTYGPVIYESYIPFEQTFGNETSDDQSAARAAAIAFDLLAVALLFLLGRRLRGPALGVAMAYAWVSYPFTLFVLETNSNDALVALLVLAALLAATYRSKVAQTARGALAALAGLTKFAPLALAPVLATHGLRELPPARRPYALALFLAGFLGAGALVFIPALSHDSLHTIYEQTVAFQANRETPFSVWGLYGGLGGLQLTVQIAAVVLALTLAVVPRRPDLVGLAAACAAVIVATQLGLNYWFYLYIPWFFPVVMLALLGRSSTPTGAEAPRAWMPARSTPPAARA